ncbi:MAG: NAD-dependent epimerase/dehydratase family protein, partial [Nitrospirales bacterium]
TRIVRIFNTYGPRMRPKDGRVVSNFIVQALQGHPLTVYGDGSQTRSFCYVDDLVAGILSLLQAPPDEFRKNQDVQDSVRFGKTQANLGSIHDPVNIGNPQELTVMDIAKTVIKLTNSSSTITQHPLPIDDPKVRRPNIEKATTLLKWEPRITLEQGLEKAIDYFRSHLDLAK